MTASEVSEQTPLIGPPSTIDASLEGHLEDSDRDLKQKDEHRISNLRIVVSTIALAGLISLQATNISIIPILQSSIVEDLELYDSTTWFTSSYLIALSSISPLNGKLAEAFSPRICIFVAAIILGLGTLVTAISNDFYTFLLGRIITGIGASGVFAVATIAILELSSIKRRGLNIALLNTGYTFGVALGATTNGALLPYIGWRWCFLGQTPLALAGGLALFVAMPSRFSNTERSSKSMSWQLARLDYLGALVLTVTIVLVLYAFSAPGPIPALPLIIAPFTLALFILIEVKFAHDPIIPVTLLRSRGLLLTCLATVGYMMSRWAVLFYAPTYTLALRSWSPATSGAILIPTNAGFAIGGLLTGWLHIRRSGSYYVPSLIVYIIFPITLVFLAMLSTPVSPIALYVLDIFLCGAVTGAAINYNLAHVLHLTPKSTHYVATSLIATFRGFSGSFGSAIGGGIFTRTLSRSLYAGYAERDLAADPDLIRRLIGVPVLVQELNGVEHEIAVAGYQSAFQALYLAGATLSTITVLVQAGTGWKAPPEEQNTVIEDEDRDIDETSDREI